MTEQTCTYCNNKIDWSTKVRPPEGVKKKDGSEYNGWWVFTRTEIRHDKEACAAKKQANQGPSPVDTQKPLVTDDNIPNIAPDQKMFEAMHVYGMALAAAHSEVKTRYPNGHPAFSQIRSDVARSYVQIWCALLKKETIEKTKG